MTEEEESNTDTIDFEIEKKEDNSLLVGETKVYQEGEDGGEMEIVDKVYKRNGLETKGRISEEIYKEPVKR